MKDPSFSNWPGLNYAILNDIVPDSPLCNKSFNLLYAGTDLYFGTGDGKSGGRSARDAARGIANAAVEVIDLVDGRADFFHQPVPSGT